VSVLHVFAHFADERMCVGVLRGRGEIGLGDIAGENAGLGAEEEEALEQLPLFFGAFEGDGGLASVKMGDQALAEGEFGLRVFFASFRILFGLVLAALDGVHVGEDQLGVDDFDVAHGVNRAADVGDVAIFKAAHHMYDGVYLTDVAEEFVAQAFTLARAFDEAGNVHEFDGGRHQLRGPGDLRKHGEALIRHGDDAGVRLDGAEGIIGCLRLAGAGDSVKKGGFANVRKAYNTGSEHKGREISGVWGERKLALQTRQN